MELPRNFPQPPINAIASYDSTDLATGEGIISYYLATNKTSAATGYILTRDSSTYSNDESTSDALDKDDDTTYRIDQDIDFDASQFQEAQVFQGTANIQVTWGCTQAYTSDANGVYLIFKIRKYSNSTETEIASVQTETWDDGKGAVLKTSLVPVVIPRTYFAVGDVLRVTLEVWTMLDSAIANGTYYVYHDPVNRNGTASNPNHLILKMPQRLER